MTTGPDSMLISTIRLVAGGSSPPISDSRASQNSLSSHGITYTQQFTCQTPDTMSISTTLLAATRFGNLAEEESSLTPSLSMTFQRTSTTFSSAETGCPSLLGSPMTTVSSSSSALPIPVSSSTFKMKDRHLDRVLPPINGESSTSTHLKAILISIRLTLLQNMTVLQHQTFQVSSTQLHGAILKVTVSVFAELLFTCRYVSLKPAL